MILTTTMRVMMMMKEWIPMSWNKMNCMVCVGRSAFNPDEIGLNALLLLAYAV